MFQRLGAPDNDCTDQSPWLSSLSESLLELLTPCLDVGNISNRALSAELIHTILRQILITALTQWLK